MVEFKIGDKVKVKRGIFCGHEGKVTELKDDEIKVVFDEPQPLAYIEDRNAKFYLENKSFFTYAIGDKDVFELIEE